MKSERMKNSIFNSIYNLTNNIFTTIFSFIVRTIFIKVLGEQCLGLDGLFTNILSLLSLAELGFGTAISFSLYEPIAKNDNDKIERLMCYFKNVYRKIAFLILLLGLLLMPFLNIIVKGYTIEYNLCIIYFLYLINTVSTYFVSYSVLLLEADQKNYELMKYKILFIVVVYGLQIVALIIYKNFLLYLGIQFFFRFVERAVIHKYIKKKYKIIDFSSKNNINEIERKKISKNIKGLLFHNIGDYAVNSTDNILISSILNIAITGIYSNYLSVISVIKSLINSIISAATASFGNLNVLEKEETKKNVFEILNFICLFLAGIATLEVFFCINPLIELWIGNNYLLGLPCVIIISINLYLNCIMLSVSAVKNSAGLYYVDRYVPILQAIINIVCSIVLGIKYGLIGILLGTTISSVLTINITRPLVIYKYVFKTNALQYFLNVLKNIILLVITIICVNFIANNINIDNNFIELLTLGVVVAFVYSIVFLIFNFKDKNLIELKKMIKRK